MRLPLATALLGLCAATTTPASEPGDTCIASISYWPLDSASVGAGNDGQPALGNYERISPDGRFILRSFSGARLGQVSLIELPARPGAPIRAHPTGLSNEAFPVQGSWRYLVDVNGTHYRFADVLRLGAQARPLFKAGMTGFYAAAAELPAPDALPHTVHIRSLSWPQSAGSDAQGVGPLQLATITVEDDGHSARVRASTGARHICGARVSVDGNAFALPMLSVDGSAFSAIPQAPRQGRPSMRIYSLDPAPSAHEHPCALRADLGHAPAKAVFGFAPPDTPAWLAYSDRAHVHVFAPELGRSFRLEHIHHRVVASAFPGLTADGRVIYAASWDDCSQGGPCRPHKGYVVADPYQSRDWREHWQALGQPAPKHCITESEVQTQRQRFARFHGLPAEP